MQLKLVPDAVEIVADTDTQRIPYSQIKTAAADSHKSVTIAPTEGAQLIFHLQQCKADAADKLVEELDDRIQFTRHSLQKEEQLLNLAQSGAQEFERQTSAVTKRRLEEMTGKTEDQRIGAIVDNVLKGLNPKDAREVSQPLQHFLDVTFVELQKEQATVAGHIREVMDDLQTKILDERRTELEGALFEVEPNTQAEILRCEWYLLPTLWFVRNLN